MGRAALQTALLRRLTAAVPAFPSIACRGHAPRSQSAAATSKPTALKPCSTHFLLSTEIYCYVSPILHQIRCSTSKIEMEQWIGAKGGAGWIALQVQQCIVCGAGFRLPAVHWGGGVSDA